MTGGVVSGSGALPRGERGSWGGNVMDIHENGLALLAGLILAGGAWPDLVAAMRDLRDADVSRREVLEVLESLRADSLDDQTEDTLLDLMDIAAGFCPIEKSLWRRLFSR